MIIKPVMRKKLFNFYNVIFVISILLIMGLSVFASRSFLFNEINIAYIEDLYSHSQWSIPLSTRVMSDGNLHQIAGYRLVRGASAFSINPEVPPIGKYLYGLSISWWKNPYLISIILYFIAILLFSAISFKFFSNSQLIKLSVLFFLLSPILVDQISKTMLDLPQLVFLLAHVLTILYINQPRRQISYFNLILLSGISLGLFAAIKIPIFVLPILFLDFLYLKKSKKIVVPVLLALIVGVVYFISYAPTLIIYKMSLFDWIRSQFWMINFYRISEVQNNPIFYLSAIFLGRYKGWWDNSAWQHIREWTILWPISIISTLGLWFKKQISDETGYIVGLATMFLFIWLLVPFWGRYFLLAMPFLIIGFVKLFENRKKFLLILAIILFIRFSFYLLPNLSSTLSTVEEKFNDGNYQDFYHLIETDIDRDKFYLILKDIELNTLSEDISLKFIGEIGLNIFKKKVNLSARVKYKTPIGIYEHQCQMSVINRQNQWKLIWNWECVAPNFKPGDELKTTLFYAKQGNLIGADELVLSQWGRNDFILIDTQKIRNDDLLLEPDLAKILNIKEARIEKKLYVDYRGSSQAPMGFVTQSSSEEIISRLKTNPAVSFVFKPTRVYHSNLSPRDLKIIEDIEEQHLELFGQNGGELVLISGNKQNVLINKKTIEGQSVMVEEKLTLE